MGTMLFSIAFPNIAMKLQQGQCRMQKHQLMPPLIVRMTLIICRMLAHHSDLYKATVHTALLGRCIENSVPTACVATCCVGCSFILQDTGTMIHQGHGAELYQQTRQQL